MNMKENVEAKDVVYILTCLEAGSAPKGAAWGYRFIGGALDGRRNFGYSTPCGCAECNSCFDGTIGEYYAIYLALQAASELAPNGKYELCFGSEYFKVDYETDVLERFGQAFICHFLEVLGVGIHNLLQSLDVRLTHYTYANNGCIPMF